MKFGHFCLPTFFPDVDGNVGLLMRRWLDLLAESETLGFDSLWANEHHFDPYGGIIPSPPTLLAALSQRTRQVRLGTSIVVLPLHSPIEIAEQLAMVDLMSSGRVEFGIGRGFVEFDYDRLHVPRADSNERMREQLEVILKAWTGEPFSHKGRFYQYENLEVWPKPEQRPHPPIWVSCSRTPSSFAWAGERGFNVLTVAYHSVQNLVAMNKLYRDAWDTAGHPKGKSNLATHYHCVLAETKREAREIAGKAWRRYTEATTHTIERVGPALAGPAAEARRKGMEDLWDTDRMVEELRQIACTPDECVTLLERAQDAMGFTQCDCTFFFGGITFDQAQRSLRLFANEVMPKLKNREPRLTR
jgi:natural product biosynthesis luciferase-like monooxygenase protein